MIKVGAPTEVELKEKKAKLEDALSATRAAVEEGIVAGGGIALLRTDQVLADLEDASEGDERTAVRLLRQAIESPLRQISHNAGEEGSVVIDKVRKNKSWDFGYDAKDDRYGNMFKFGIVDPVKVVRSTIENATSIGGMVLTTESLVADIPQAPAAPVGEPAMDY